MKNLLIVLLALGSFSTFANDPHICDVNNSNNVTYTLNSNLRIPIGQSAYIVDGEVVHIGHDYDDQVPESGYCKIGTKSVISAQFGPSEIEKKELKKLSGKKVEKLNENSVFKFKAGSSFQPASAPFTSRCMTSGRYTGWQVESDYWVNFGLSSGGIEVVTCVPRLNEGKKKLTLSELKAIVEPLITVDLMGNEN